MRLRRKIRKVKFLPTAELTRKGLVVNDRWTLCETVNTGRTLTATNLKAWSAIINEASWSSSSIIDDRAHVVERSPFKLERWQGEWARGVSIFVNRVLQYIETWKSLIRGCYQQSLRRPPVDSVWTSRTLPVGELDWWPFLVRAMRDPRYIIQRSCAQSIALILPIFVLLSTLL